MSKTVGDSGEFELIDHIEKLISQKGVKASGNTLAIGDDAASFEPRAGYELLVTCDSMIEGRHYMERFFTPFETGRRAMVMNISDIGAMGGRPLYALVSLALKPDMQISHVEEFYRGFLEELNPFNAAIIGGNITGTEHAATIGITLIGEAEKSKKVLRSTAREGDVIMVTGYPGQAAAGLRLLLNSKEGSAPLNHPLVDAYIMPVHRAFEGHALALTGKVTSMIDLSDGFLGDLTHICERSGVGAEINISDFPVSEPMKEIYPEDIYQKALGASDDYELIFTCSSEDVKMLSSIVKKTNNIPVHEVGRITKASEGIKVIQADGIFSTSEASGWNHFR